jgi:formylglycine-generating enzyme required for sulfatase activity
MTAIISLKGIDEAFAALGYRSPKTLKSRLFRLIRAHYQSEEDISAIETIAAEELTSKLWDIGGDPKEIRKKRKNLSSLKSALNADLKRAYENGANRDGIIIGPKNVFVMSEAAKDRIVSTMAATLTPDGGHSLLEILETLRTLEQDLLHIRDWARTETGVANEFDYLKKIVRSISNQLGVAQGEEGISENPRDGDRNGFAREGETGEPDEEYREAFESTKKRDGPQGKSPEIIEVIEEVTQQESDTTGEPGQDDAGDKDDGELREETDEPPPEEDLPEEEDLEEVPEEELSEEEIPEEPEEELEPANEDDEFEELETDENTGGQEAKTGKTPLPQAEEIIELVEEAEEIEPRPGDGDEGETAGELYEGEAGETDEREEETEELPPEEDLEEVLEEDISEEELPEELEEPEEELETGTREPSLGDSISLDEFEEVDEEEIVILEEVTEDELKDALTGEDGSLLEKTDRVVEILEDFEGYGGSQTQTDDLEDASLRAYKFNRYLGNRYSDQNQYATIPEGTYLVGDPLPDGNARREKRIQIKAFRIGTFPVTNALFEAFVEQTGYVTVAEKEGFGTVYEARLRRILDPQGRLLRLSILPHCKRNRVDGACWYRPTGPGSTIHGRTDHPVVQICVEDAMAFCAWTGRRLPSEDEWEAAARTETGFLLPWGSHWKKGFCNVEEGYFGDTTAVAAFQGHENSLGISDTLGNVFELTASFEEVESIGGPPRKCSVGKGGSWISGPDVRLCDRFLFPVDFRSNTLGFRCALQ